jgi:hypothetical protein
MTQRVCAVLEILGSTKSDNVKRSKCPWDSINSANMNRFGEDPSHISRQCHQKITGEDFNCFGSGGSTGGESGSDLVDPTMNLGSNPFHNSFASGIARLRKVFSSRWVRFEDNRCAQPF